jgi:hypothetical protein
MADHKNAESVSMSASCNTSVGLSVSLSFTLVEYSKIGDSCLETTSRINMSQLPVYRSSFPKVV